MEENASVSENNQAETDKDRQVSPIGEIELEAMRMRFEAYTSAEMSRILTQRFGDRAPSAGVIRGWFCRGGKLVSLYDEYVRTEGAYRRNEARAAFKAHIKNAVRVLLQIMNDKDGHTPSRVRAAEDVINRELGEPVRPVANLNVKNPAREILEDAGLIEKTHDTGEAGEGS